MQMKISKSKSGLPLIGVGGGGFTSTYSFRVVCHSNGKLKKELYARRGGALACELDQAFVVIKLNDLIVEGKGHRREDKEERSICVYRVVNVFNDYAEVEEINKDIKLPEKVYDGAFSYHNRDYRYFVRSENE